MSLEQAKNALVATLFELSNAAKDAATATVTFYKATGVDGSSTASSLVTLSESISGAVKAAEEVIALSAPANGVAEPKKKAVRAKKAPAKEAEEPVAEASEETTEKVEKPAEKPVVKKKKVEKDPNAPKKPLTTYLRFNLSVRDQMRKERFQNGQPTYPATELNQIIADRWANLSVPEKEKLQKAYESEYEIYKKELGTYNANKKEEAAAAPTEESEPVKEPVKTPAKAKAAPKTPAKESAKSPVKESAKSPTKEAAKDATKEPVKKKTVTKKDAVAAKTDDAATPKKTKKRKEKDDTKADHKVAKKKKTD